MPAKPCLRSTRDVQPIEKASYLDRHGRITPHIGKAPEPTINHIKGHRSKVEGVHADVELVRTVGSERNEKALELFSLESGDRFEPDYIVFASLRSDASKKFQIFIEPKGDQFTRDGTFDDGPERWKQDLLLCLEASFTFPTVAESDHFRVVGLPFYNEKSTAETVRSMILELADS